MKDSIVKENMVNPTLAEALSAILAHGRPTATESIAIEGCLGRVAAASLKAQQPVPGYCQSARDGFVLGGDRIDEDDSPVSYEVVGEVPAGCSVAHPTLERRQAYRIMTGAKVPPGGVRIVPQEDCQMSGTRVLVPVQALASERRYIQPVGSEIAGGSPLIDRGTVLAVEHVALLAMTGSVAVKVHRLPRVAYLCSGSELVNIGETPLPGQKLSSNKYLLNGLIRSCGAIPIDIGIVKDHRESIRSAFSQALDSGAEVIVSTGGVGPGKYDLFAGVFEALGGNLLYRALAIRPGKASLFGVLGPALYFGLPGPPGAVRVLFRELVGPLICRISGRGGAYPVAADAYLMHDLEIRDSVNMTLKEGVVFFDGGRVCVRSPVGNEAANCHMLLSPGRRCCRPGDSVKVHLF